MPQIIKRNENDLNPMTTEQELGYILPFREERDITTKHVSQHVSQRVSPREQELQTL